MNAVHVFFASDDIAYQFVSEIRRQSDTFLGDLRVRLRHDGAEVVIPERLWWREPFIKSVADDYGGNVQVEPITGPSDAREGM